jgi:hypothetical protein
MRSVIGAADRDVGETQRALVAVRAEPSGRNCLDRATASDATSKSGDGAKGSSSPRL